MKSTRLYNLLVLSFLFASTCVISSCKQENAATPDTLSAKTDGEISGVTDLCTTCQYEDMYKTTGNNTEVVGTIAICQTLTDLTISFSVSNPAHHFNKTGYGIYLDPPPALNPSPKLFDEIDHGVNESYATYTIPLSEIAAVGSTIYIATYALVPTVGGMIWAGNLTPETQNPNSRYFSYTIKQCETPPCPTSDCFFSQGYYFAKPGGLQWPVSTITFGGYEYSYADARTIFFSSNKKGKTDAKQAFLQGLAFKLNLAGGADPAVCSGGETALQSIEAFFIGKGQQTGDKLNGYSASTSLKSAAGLISNCINANHCDKADQVIL